MPIVNVTWTGRQDRNVKNDFYDFTAGLINRETGTDPNLIYVFIREIEKENTRKRGTVVFVDWTVQPARTVAARTAIMKEMTKKIAAVTGEDPEEIVIIFRDIPLHSASVGGLTREEKL